MPKLGESTDTARELVVEQTRSQLEAEKDADENSRIALTTMLMALLAAFGALMAGISAQEALLDRTEGIIAVTIQESDRVAVDILKAKHDILITLGEKPDETELAQIADYERQATEFADEAQFEESKVQGLVLPHLLFAVAVTLLSVGIAMNGIAVVVKKRLLWLVGMAFGLLGAIGILAGVLTMTVS